jgi:16S rRNA (guanine527-N7)-methyltransferase
MTLSLAAILDNGLAVLALDLSGEQRARLLDFIRLLEKWNRTYNLTAIREPHAMLIHHVLDSLAVLPLLKKSVVATRRTDPWRLTDVGSGAGLPGIVLAIAQPDWLIRSIDTVDKKAAFQRQVVIELGLKNVEVVSGRVEKLSPASTHAVISRAFAELADFVALAGHLIVPGGSLFAMKGVLPESEIARLPPAWHATLVAPIDVPGLNAQRHVIVLEKM